MRVRRVQVFSVREPQRDVALTIHWRLVVHRRARKLWQLEPASVIHVRYQRKPACRRMTMTAITFNLDFPEGRKAPLFCQFEGELGPQPAFIPLNPDTREVSADYTPEVGTAVPVAVWH